MGTYNITHSCDHQSLVYLEGSMASLQADWLRLNLCPACATARGYTPASETLAYTILYLTYNTRKSPHEQYARSIEEVMGYLPEKDLIMNERAVDIDTVRACLESLEPGYAEIISSQNSDIDIQIVRNGVLKPGYFEDALP